MSYELKTKNYSLTVAWLYPDLMSTYGDHGNILSLQKRAEWREIDVEIMPLSIGSSAKDLASCDLVFMGGAQDRQQQIVSNDIKKGKAQALSEMIENEVPGLYICGAYQFLGKYYKEADDTILDGLGVLDLYTENPGPQVKRLIGNVMAETIFLDSNTTIVGFENHGGRTYLGKNIKPLAKVLKGFGNNGQDGTEGAIYKNSLGSYFHGPILPKNPALSDFLLRKALERKYKQTITLKPLDDALENQAHEAIVRKLGVGV